MKRKAIRITAATLALVLVAGVSAVTNILGISDMSFIDRWLSAEVSESDTVLSNTDTSETDAIDDMISSTDSVGTVISETDISDSNNGEVETTPTEVEEEPPVFQIEAEKSIYCKDAVKIKTLIGEAVSYSSSDKNIATVSKKGTVTTHHAGEVIITAKDADGNTSQCKITVIKVVYLTIDDWPNKHTDSILKTLDEYDVVATFFLCAGKASKPYYQRIVDEGHVVANHTASHKSSEIYQSKEAFYNSVVGMNNYLKNHTNLKSIPKLLRFPTGTKGNSNQDKIPEILEYMVYNRGYHVFDWTAEFRDTRVGATAESCLEAVKNQCKDDREILLMHHHGHSAEALPQVIEYLLEQGYTFAPLTMETTEYNFVGMYY